VTARGLRKSYGAFEAVKGIDVEVYKGEAFGFLGPNGAGKSSTMRMIAAVSPVSGGSLRILDMDPASSGSRIRARIGVCPQENTLDTELSVVENLMVYGRFFGLSRAQARDRADELLAFVQLTDRAGAKVEALSGGMKRRLTIARALMFEPRLLILDEPTAGVDVELRLELWAFLRELNREGMTIILTTHYLEEAEELCSRIGIIEAGKLVALESTRKLIGERTLQDVFLELTRR
jgi:lipooligosaccharide transport system ATP-binding protein